MGTTFTLRRSQSWQPCIVIDCSLPAYGWIVISAAHSPFWWFAEMRLLLHTRTEATPRPKIYLLVGFDDVGRKLKWKEEHIVYIVERRSWERLCEVTAVNSNGRWSQPFYWCLRGCFCQDLRQYAHIAPVLPDSIGWLWGEVESCQRRWIDNFTEAAMNWFPYRSTETLQFLWETNFMPRCPHRIKESRRPQNSKDSFTKYRVEWVGG